MFHPPEYVPNVGLSGGLVRAVGNVTRKSRQAGKMAKDMSEQGNDEPRLSPFAGVLARLADRHEASGPAARSAISDQVESLIVTLRAAIDRDWPTVDELRRLPPEDFTNFARQLSLLIDRLTALRVELLSDRRPRL